MDNFKAVSQDGIAEAKSQALDPQQAAMRHSQKLPSFIDDQLPSKWKTREYFVFDTHVNLLKERKGSSFSSLQLDPRRQQQVAGHVQHHLCQAAANFVGKVQSHSCANDTQTAMPLRLQIELYLWNESPLIHLSTVPTEESVESCSGI